MGPTDIQPPQVLMQYCVGASCNVIDSTKQQADVLKAVEVGVCETAVLDVSQSGQIGAPERAKATWALIEAKS